VKSTPYEMKRGVVVRSSVELLAALPLVASLALGCGSDDDGPPPDDGGRRDALVVDGGPEPDGSVASDGGGLDGAVDAGFVGCSRGACDPSVGVCGDAGVCVLDESAPRCVDVGMEGELGKGEACMTPDDCARGLACVMRRGGGVCAALCCPDESATCGDLTERCAGTGTLVDGTPTDWWTCVGPRTCDVLEPDATCDPGEGCYIVSSSRDTDCRRAGALDVGDACVMQEDCGPGLFCLIGAPMPTCARICAIGATSGPRACPSGEGSCIAYAYSPDGTGICTPSMM
jgi:hypothetical protein